MLTRLAPAIPADPREWRPQKVRRVRGQPHIVDPIAEPLWSGTRVMVHYRASARADQWGEVEVLDESGRDASHLAPIALDFLRRSVLAIEAVIDGIISAQATGGGVRQPSSRVQRLRRLFGHRGSDGGCGHPRRGLHDGEAAFVALDLLSIDGQRLFDVPLLERKRLLDSAIEQSELVRVSPVVRPPLRNWFAAWHSAGFRGLIIKAANSRYMPGAATSEWAVVERMPSS
jgi:ATP-dependent DNA ligase